jgi:hypothetical protein
VFTKNRDRLLNQDLAREFLRRVVERATPYVSDEHFTVDGTVIEGGPARRVSNGKTAAPIPTGATFMATRAPMTRLCWGGCRIRECEEPV